MISKMRSDGLILRMATWNLCVAAVAPIALEKGMIAANRAGSSKTNRSQIHSAEQPNK